MKTIFDSFDGKNDLNLITKRIEAKYINKRMMGNIEAKLNKDIMTKEKKKSMI